MAWATSSTLVVRFAGTSNDIAGQKNMTIAAWETFVAADTHSVAGRRPLAAAIALAFSVLCRAGDIAPSPGYSTPSAPATIRVVTNCEDDDSPGSLRSVLASALSGDMVDLRNLTCSSISIYDGRGSMSIPADKVYLIGGYQTITGNGTARVFTHTGSDELAIQKLDISAGRTQEPGGCIYSASSVVLYQVSVHDCRGTDLGGGVFAQDDFKLVESTITRNAVDHHSAQAAGGGVYAGRDLVCMRSTISDNVAASYGVFRGYGGGFVAGGSVHIERSTISGNLAAVGGAIWAPGVNWSPYDPYARFLLDNSTVSGNTAARLGGVLFGAGSVIVSDSTIAFNETTELVGGCLQTAGLCILGQSTGNPTRVQSSIIASNTGASAVASDLYSIYPITGSHNLIVLANAAGDLPDSLHDDPELAPLADNGGPFLTHALAPTSPAIDTGGVTGWAIDERGFPRPVGAGPDIGAYELQKDRIFGDGFEPPS